MKLPNLDNKILRWMFCLITLLLIRQSVYAQNSLVRGTVRDEEGAALPGVNVLVKGTTVRVSKNLQFLMA